MSRREIAKLDRELAALRRVGRSPAREDIYDTDIIALKSEAGIAGDMEQVELCRAALGGDAKARRECARVIAEARAQDDGR